MPEKASAPVPSAEEVRALREHLDLLWGLLPSAEVRELRSIAPATYRACHENHTLLHHS